MLNLLHLISLATAAVSLASAATIGNILNYAGNAFNIDLDAGAIDYSTVNAYPPIASAANEEWIIVPVSADQSQFKIQSASVSTAYLSSSALLERAPRSSSSITSVTGKVVTSWSTPGSTATDRPHLYSTP
ncbi:hypothetical protein B0H10DRAFT_1944646 [Mycena sp. CBHHK59/15]|nr:hypothetical protein B0H10DRAFT_1944646 [Mycena sp. CBHHK59/15]